MENNEETCEHLEALDTNNLKTADEYVCKECIAMGDRWVHLRTCQECGHVGCCDSSKNKHAHKHFYSTGHPVATSAEPGERWAYCYKDDTSMLY